MASAPCGAATWRPFILDACCHAPHATYPDGGPETAPRVAPLAVPIRFCSRCGLPCRFRCRTRGALLPHLFTLTAPKAPTGEGERFVLCGTVSGVAPAGRYPAPYVDGARTFLPGHLSMIAGAAVRPTDAVGMGAQDGRVKPALPFRAKPVPHLMRDGYRFARRNMETEPRFWSI